MDPLVIAKAAVSLMVPYLAQAAEVAMKKAGEAAWEKVKGVWALVQKKLSGDSYAEQTVKRLEEAPESESRQAALVGVLEEKFKSDLAFAEAIQKLLDEAATAGLETIAQKVNISDHARAGNITQIGKMEGNIDFGKKQ